MEASRKNLVGSIIVAIIVAVVLSGRHMAIVLPLFVLFLIIRIGKLLYAFATGGEVDIERRQCTIILAAMILVVVCAHVVRHMVARNYANDMIAAIEQYTARHQRCPTKLEDFGYSHERIRDHLEYSGYVCEGGEPHFSYAVTFSLFDLYQYDFKTKQWQYRHD